MNIKQERRKKKRLNYDWSIWFAEGFGKTLYYGEILNISSEALALICKTDKNLTQRGCRVTAYFNVPHIGRNDSSDVIMLSCQGCVLRIDTVEDNKFLRQIVIIFDKPLSFEPEKIKRVNLLFHSHQRKINSSSSTKKIPVGI